MGEWSPSHLVVAAIAVATIVGQLIIVLTRLKTTTERLEKQIDKQSENMRQMGEMFFRALERLEGRMDKRFVEVNQRIDETNQRIDGLRSDMNQQIDGLRSEMNQQIDGLRSDMNQQIDGLRSDMNQRLSDMNGEIVEVRSEMNQRLSDMTTEIGKLNQNHIDHLNRHHIP